jgi:hypothetical protein
VIGISDALVSMNGTEQGRQLLATLRLDGFTPGNMALFDGIAQKYREVLGQS